MTAVLDVAADPVTQELSFLWLEITGKCNLTCGHCYADSGPLAEVYGSMTFDDWTRVLDEAADLGCRQVQFIGGEPTMHPHLSDLVDRANHKGFEFIEVFTNATRLGSELVGCFRRNRVQVATSFYSDDPSTHDRITRVHGSWARTVEGIRKVVDAGLSLRAGLIEMEENAGHFERTSKFLQELGVSSIGNDRRRGVGRGDMLDIGERRERFEELCGHCWEGKLCVTPSGESFPCVFSRATPLGDARSGLTAILMGQKLWTFRSALHEYTQSQGSITNCHPDCSPACNPTCNPNNPCNPKNPCAPNQDPNCFPNLSGPTPPCWPKK